MDRTRQFNFIFIALLVGLCACKLQWTDALKLGTVNRTGFAETVEFEIRNGLIIVPVKLHGVSYRFLFDTGAPLSISQKVQERFGFEVISKGRIVDSDQNRSAVQYAKIDLLDIGGVPFIDQTAFVADFDASPVLRCLDIDGIIGSNLMRHCNWMVNFDTRTLGLSSLDRDLAFQNNASIPFHTDAQYNVLTSVIIGSSEFKNLTIDFGSNGPISIPRHIFETLKRKNLTGEVFSESGLKQSGIVGEPVRFQRQITYSDSVRFGEIGLTDVELRTGNDALVGTKILSRFNVGIDWLHKELLLAERGSKDVDHRTFGFRAGPSNGSSYLVVQSVTENSVAFGKGIRPDMRISKINGLNFQEADSFCDYVELIGHAPDTLDLEVVNGDSRQEIRLVAKPLTKVEE